MIWLAFKQGVKIGIMHPELEEASVSNDQMSAEIIEIRNEIQRMNRRQMQDLRMKIRGNTHVNREVMPDNKESNTEEKDR